ncbi:MAG: hypothetical protein WAL16_16270 [Streptosporangiaceae bacterium]|jgi:hypothetical protein
MRTVLPAPGFERPAETVGEALVPGLFPWTIRLAGPQSAWPALEVYEAGTLLDVISSTRLLVSLLRGARAGDGTAGPCALAWGRLIAPDAGLSAEFSRGRLRPTTQAGAVTRMGGWCWLAVADGTFDSVTVRSGGRTICGRLRRRRP